MTLSPKAVTLSSSVFPYLVIISMYVINCNMFIFWELVLFSLQLMYMHLVEKDGFKERNV